MFTLEIYKVLGNNRETRDHLNDVEIEKKKKIGYEDLGLIVSTDLKPRRPCIDTSIKANNIFGHI